ncbi:MAG: hypothetical protein RL685_2514 [Pseudomonadota bacterium]|jgi:hypothetical protein
MSLWSLAIAATLALTSVLALRPLGARWARSPHGGGGARAIAALRLCLMTLVVLGVLAALGAWSHSAPRPLQWALWAVTLLGALAWLTNAIAGLWLLSPRIDAAPGTTIVACGQRGRIVGYGVTSLELATDQGMIAHLPYLAISRRPLLIDEQRRARSVELTFAVPGWTQGHLDFLRQAAVLAPFRDVASPVTLSRSGDQLSVRVSLAHHAAEEEMRKLLERRLAEYLTPAPPHAAREEAHDGA